MAILSKKNKKQAKLYKQWKRYLSDSRLSDEEIVRRAKTFTRKGMRPNES